MQLPNYRKQAFREREVMRGFENKGRSFCFRPHVSRVSMSARGQKQKDRPHLSGENECI